MNEPFAEVMMKLKKGQLASKVFDSIIFEAAVSRTVDEALGQIRFQLETAKKELKSDPWPGVDAFFMVAKPLVEMLVRELDKAHEEGIRYAETVASFRKLAPIVISGVVLSQPMEKFVEQVGDREARYVAFLELHATSMLDLMQAETDGEDAEDDDIDDSLKAMWG